MSASPEFAPRRMPAMLCGLALAACAPWAPRDSAPVPRPEAPPAAASAVPAPSPAAQTAPAVPAATAVDLATRDMLAFQERARQLPPADLAKEIARLSDTPGNPRTAFELALLLGQTRSNGDLARALTLLDGLLRSNAPEAAPWQPLARLVAVRFAEQRRLEEQVERQNQQARENQRRIEQLNEKLEALKAIERSLTTRPAPASGAAAAPAPAAKGSAP